LFFVVSLNDAIHHFRTGRFHGLRVGVGSVLRRLTLESPRRDAQSQPRLTRHETGQFVRRSPMQVSEKPACSPELIDGANDKMLSAHHFDDSPKGFC
jgi:hypothetical protein